MAESNGLQCASIINSIKEKARRSGESPYPTELEGYCRKLEVVKTVFEDVIKSTAAFNKEIIGSINILESMKDNEELRLKMVKIKSFLDALTSAYESSLKLKLLIIGEYLTKSVVLLVLLKLGCLQRTLLTQPPPNIQSS